VVTDWFWTTVRTFQKPNVPDKEPGMYAPGSSITTLRLTEFKGFFLRKVGTKPKAAEVIKSFLAKEGREEGQGTVSGAQPRSAGVAAKGVKDREDRLASV
jgi:hypothetical protein